MANQHENQLPIVNDITDGHVRVVTAAGESARTSLPARVREVVLTGLSTATSAAIAATDSVLSALGKLQAQVTARVKKAGDTMTGALALAADSTAPTAAADDNSTKLANTEFVQREIGARSRKNLFYNGAFRVNQRQAASKTAAVGYNFDCWYYDGTYLYTFVDEVDLRDGTYALSWASDATAEYQLVSNATASSALPSLGWTAVSNGGSFALASASGNLLWVRFAAGVDGLEALNFVQLEWGAIATEFEWRPFPEELLLCRNVLRKTYPVATQIGALNTKESALLGIATGTNNRPMLDWRFEMRGVPEVTLYSPVSGIADKCYNQTGTSDADAVLYRVSRTSAQIYTPGTNTDGAEFLFHAVASAEP